MLTTQQSVTRWMVIGIAACAIGVCVMPSASAQSDNQPSAFVDVTKHVVLDPTTFLPAILGYDATMRDWKSSQPFFQHGFVERNGRYTVSGMPNDRAVSYEAGKQRILGDAFSTLGLSLVNNVGSGIAERLLEERHPEHRTLWRTLGWVERIAFASYLSYEISAPHYRQWRENERLAARLGFD